MGKFGKAIMKYMKLYKKFIINCIQAEMEYRVNFFMGMFVECAWLVSKILYALVIYNSNISIGHYTPNDILIFSGVHTLMTGILISFFWPNYSKITQYIKEGTLDMYLIKPVSEQFIVTTRYMSCGTLIPNVLGGIVMMNMGMRWEGIHLTFSMFLFMILFIVCGTVISYCVFLLPQMLSFRVIEMNAINEIAGQLQEVNNVPYMVYPSIVQRFGIYIVPIFLISNFLPLFLIDGFNAKHILLMIFWAVLSFTIVRLLWRREIRHYSSASS